MATKSKKAAAILKSKTLVDECGMVTLDEGSTAADFKVVTFGRSILEIERKAQAIRKHADEMALHYNQALAKYGFHEYELSSEEIHKRSDWELEEEFGKIMTEGYKVSTSLMADSAVNLSKDFMLLVYKKEKTVIIIKKDTQAGKSRDAQNFAILASALLYSEHEVFLYPLIMLNNETGLEDQLRREWPLQRAFWRHMTLLNYKNKKKIHFNKILAEWDMPELAEEHIDITDGCKGFWIMRRANSKAIWANWTRKIEAVKNNSKQHLLLIHDEGDHGVQENGVTDRLFEETDLYRYLRTNRKNANITLCEISATIDCTHDLIQDFSVNKILPTDEGYRSQDESFASMAELAEIWDLPELLQLGNSTHSSGNPYCSLLAYVCEKLQISRKEAKKLLINKTQRKQYEAEWNQFRKKVPKMLAKIAMTAIDKGWNDEKLGHMKFRGVAIRYCANNNDLEELYQKLQHELKNFLVVPYFGNVAGVTRTDYRKRKDVQNAINAVAREEGKSKDQPILLLWSSSGRRGNQVPDGFIQFDYTKKPSVDTSRKQNAGRPAGYKKASLFACTEAFSEIMTKAKNGNSPLEPSYHSMRAGVSNTNFVLSLNVSDGLRKFKQIDKIFTKIEKYYLNTPPNLNKVKTSLKRKSKHIALRGMEIFHKHHPDIPSLLGYNDSIITPSDIRWLEENQEFIFRDEQGCFFEGIKINTILDLPTVDDVGYEYNAINLEGKALFSFREGEKALTNLAWCQSCKMWANAVVPQIHYEIADKGKKIRCVALHLRLSEPPKMARRTIYPKQGTLMYKLLSDNERRLTDKYRESKKKVR